MTPDPNGPRKVTVLGAGSWGTTFAKVLADAAADAGAQRTVCLWGRDPESMQRIAREHRNDRYVPEIELPETLEYSSDLRSALAGADLVVAAIPAQSLRAQLGAAASYVEPEAVILSLAKGLESGTGLRMTQVIAQVLAEHTQRTAEEWARRTCVLSGPNLAMEIARERGDRRLRAEYLLLGIIDTADDASRALIESATTADELRDAVVASLPDVKAQV